MSCICGRLAGRTHLERGEPVVILTFWVPGGEPRNVAIRSDDAKIGMSHPNDTSGPIGCGANMSTAEIGSVMNANWAKKRNLTSDDIDGMQVMH